MNAFLLLRETTSNIIMFAMLYFILAVAVDSFEMSMIVVEYDKSIFFYFTIQINLTNHVSGFIHHGLLK